MSSAAAGSKKENHEPTTRTTNSFISRGASSLAFLMHRPVFPADVVNPFINDEDVHRTMLQRLKVTALAVTVFPVRLVGFVTCLLLAWGVSKLALMGIPEKEMQEIPMKQGILKRVCFFLARACMFFLGYQWFEADTSNWEVRPDGSKKRANVIVVNHSTVCDGFLLYHLHGLHSIGVSSIAEAPIFSSFARSAQAFSLDRDSGDGRKKIGNEMLRRVTWSAEQEAQYGPWMPLTVFAEGTCTNQKCLIQFRHGAFLPGVAVQPMIVRYPFKYCDQSWCGLSNPVPSLARMMCQFHNRLQYHYLPIYEPSEEEKKDPYLFANNVRKVMAENMGVPTTEHTYEDMRLSGFARQLGLPWRKIHCEMGYFRQHGSTYERAKEMMKVFAAADSNKDGELSRAEFRTFMKLNHVDAALSDAILRVWNNGSADDQLCFRHFFFMMGLRVLSLAGLGGSSVEPLSPTPASPVPTSKLPTDTLLYDVIATDPAKRRRIHDELFTALNNGEDKGALSLEAFVNSFKQTLSACGSSSSKVESALERLFTSAEQGSSWNKQQFSAFLDAHPGMTEHLLATL